MTKYILDATCGPKHFYFNKQDSRVLYCDKRIFVGKTMQGKNGRNIKITPDMLTDFTDMPFTDNYFDVAVFDPPHLLRASNCYMKIKYGHLEGNWREVLGKGFAEYFRVLKPRGVLVFKWNETDIVVKDILALTPEQPLIGNRSGKAAKTHYIIFVKSEVAE